MKKEQWRAFTQARKNKNPRHMTIDYRRQMKEWQNQQKHKTFGQRDRQTDLFVDFNVDIWVPHFKTLPPHYFIIVACIKQQINTIMSNAQECQLYVVLPRLDWHNADYRQLNTGGTLSCTVDSKSSQPASPSLNGHSNKDGVMEKNKRCSQSACWP